MEKLETVQCPQCQTSVTITAISSLNPERHPELKKALLEDKLQSAPCPGCQNTVILEPHLAYVDLEKKYWIAAWPSDDLQKWSAREQEANQTYKKVFTTNSQDPLTQGIRPRITFGWHGLKEKVLAWENGIDDVTIELAKLRLYQSGATEHIATASLRLAEVHPEELIFDWYDLKTQTPLKSGLSVERKMLNEFTSDVEGWKALKQQVAAGLFVDVLRLTMKGS